MTSHVQLAIDVLSPSLMQSCRAMAARCQLVDLTEHAADAAALITDNPDSDAIARESGVPVLQLNPFRAEFQSTDDATGVTHSMPGLVTRFRPSIAQVKQTLDTGKLGIPGLLRIHCWNSAAVGEASVSEQLDLALWMFDDMPNAVCAVERPDFLQVHLGFETGGMAIIDLDAGIAGDSEYYSLSLIGSTGAAYADDHRNMNLLLNSDGVHGVRATEGETALAALIDHFVSSVGCQTPLRPNRQDLMKVSAVRRKIGDSVSRRDAVTGGRFGD